MPMSEVVTIMTQRLIRAAVPADSDSGAAGPDSGRKDIGQRFGKDRRDRCAI
jgi:hypothetical protein